MSRYPPEALQQFETFLADLHATIEAHLEQRNQDADRHRAPVPHPYWRDEASTS